MDTNALSVGDKVGVSDHRGMRAGAFPQRNVTVELGAK